MIMPLKATETGKISHEMSPGSIIAAGDLLASLQLAVRLVWSVTARGGRQTAYIFITSFFFHAVRSHFKWTDSVRTFDRVGRSVDVSFENRSDLSLNKRCAYSFGCAHEEWESIMYITMSSL